MTNHNDPEDSGGLETGPPAPGTATQSPAPSRVSIWRDFEAALPATPDPQPVSHSVEPAPAAPSTRVGKRPLVVAVAAIAAVLAVVLVAVLVSNDAGETTADDSDQVDLARLPGSVTDDGGLAVSREDYDAAWPLTIESGVLRCDDGAVTLETNDTTYALNAEAQSRQLGAALAPVWAPNPDVDGARMGIGILIEHGLATC